MGLTRPRAAQIYNLDYKQATRVVTVANITLTGGAPSVVDGVTLSLGDRVLVTAQSTPSQNGLYYVSTLGSGSNGTWSRTSDANQTGEIDAGMIVMVTEGLIYADTQWKLITDNPITIGTTALTFTQNYLANAIQGGTSNVTVYSNANVTISSGGTPNVLTVTSTGTVVKGTESVSGNITVGNVLTSGLISATGTITGSNIIVNGLVNVTTTTANTVTATLTHGADNNFQLTAQNGVSQNLTGTEVARFGIDYNTAGWDSFTQYIRGSASQNGYQTLWASNTQIVTVNSSGTLVAGIVSATGNVTGGNVLTAGQVSATGNINGNYLNANIYYATGFSASRIFSGTSEANIGTAGGNANISIGGVSNVAVFATTGEYVTGVVSASGNVTGANLLTSGIVSGGSNVTGANLLTSGIVSATGNIIGSNLITGLVSASGVFATTIGNSGTSLVGTITSVSGNITGGNIITAGLITAGGNVTGSNLITAGNVTATGNINGNYLNANIYYATGFSASRIFNGTSEANIGVTGGNANISIGGVSNVVVFATTGEYVTGVVSASGNITGGNILTAGSITATGNVTAGNITILGSNSVTGNITGGNLQTAGLITATGNITGGNLLINSTAIVLGNLSVQGNITFTNSNVITTNDLYIELANNQSTYAGINNAGLVAGPTGSPLTQWQYNTTANAWSTNVGVSATANVIGGNLVTVGQITATGNITAAYHLGNGSQLSGITAFNTIAATGQSNIVANSIGSTLTFAAASGSGFVWTTDAANGIITLNSGSSGTSIFATGGDMGLVTDPVTSSQDLGNVTDVASVSYDLGSVVSASGLIYPSQLILPSYTPGTLPTASPAAQFIYLSTSSIGPMTAFSDGTNWRFTSSGNVVS
jgi:hypothetical protein